MAYLSVSLVKLLITTVPVIILAVLAVRWLYPDAESSVRTAAGLLVSFVVVLVPGGILGLAGGLSFWGYSLFLWFVLAAFFVVRKFGGKPVLPEQEADKQAPLPIPMIILAVVSGTLVVGAVAAKLALPVVEYDELTYHLHFPAQWLLAKRIFIIDTPFGDAAPAYAPANGELWYAWLMAPFAGVVTDIANFKLVGIDALAKVGQAPFLLLLACALTVIVRRLGVKSWPVYLPALLLPFLPWALQQTASAHVDLMMAALLVSSLAFALQYRDDGRMASAVVSGAAMGLAAGVKFVALVYAPLLLAPIFIFLFSKRNLKVVFLWCLAAVLFGLPWYLRNLLLTGNPLFPAEFLFFDGIYNRSLMMQSEFHVPDALSALAVGVHAIGFWLAPLALGGVVGGALLAMRQRAWRALAWVAPLAFVWHFLLVPYSSQDRFLLWAAAMCLLPFAFWPASRRGMIALFAVLIPLLALDLCGPGVDFHVGILPVFRKGLLDLRAWPTLLSVLICWYLAWRITGLLAEKPAHRLTLVSVLVLLAAMFFAQPNGGRYIRVNSRTLAELPFAGYVQLWTKKPHAVAYAGRNTPYYLAGRSGKTRVLYIPLDGRADVKLYEYVQERRATGSWQNDRDKANWRLRNPDYDHWLQAFRNENIDFLFIQPLHPFGRRYYEYNGTGFSLERTWAREHPADFALLDASPRYEIYAFTRR